MRLRPWLELVPAIALVVIAAWESCATVHAADDVPGDETWHRAAELVRARFQPGDLIVFAPDWVDPVGRLHLGDLIPIADAARMDSARFATIWELSIRGAHAPETAGMDSTEGVIVDGVSVIRYTQTPAQVVSDIVALAATARTDKGAGVAAVLAEVGFAPHRCIQVIPPPGKSVRVTFPAVPVGSELVGYVGLADVFKRRDVRDPGELEVQIDGRTAARTRFGVDSGWVRFAAATTPGTSDITFVATAVGPNARDRLICFAAEARR